MKRQFVKGSFIDFEGKERNFIVAATVDKNFTLADDEKEFNGACCVKFGVAFCNSKDTFNENLGITIAEGKADKAKTRIGAIIVSSGMLVNFEHIALCLERYKNLIAAHPEQFSKSYAASLNKWKKEKSSL